MNPSWLGSWTIYLASFYKSPSYPGVFQALYLCLSTHVCFSILFLAFHWSDIQGNYPDQFWTQSSRLLIQHLNVYSVSDTVLVTRSKTELEYIPSIEGLTVSWRNNIKEKLHHWEKLECKYTEDNKVKKRAINLLEWSGHAINIMNCRYCHSIDRFHGLI